MDFLRDFKKDVLGWRPVLEKFGVRIPDVRILKQFSDHRIAVKIENEMACEFSFSFFKCNFILANGKTALVTFIYFFLSKVDTQNH